MTNEALPYPPINQHGVIGDRRTAAIVAADGTINWMCAPNYDGLPVFGSLLDMTKGGFWRFGPANPWTGEQSYVENSAALRTVWKTGSAALELCDVMLWPANERDSALESRRTVVRRLRCLEGSVTARFHLLPRLDFGKMPQMRSQPGGCAVHFGEQTFGLWTSFDITTKEGEAFGDLEMQQGDTAWAVFGLNETTTDWNIERAESLFDSAVNYWQDWVKGLQFPTGHLPAFVRSAVTVHLLAFAPAGSVVAAPTTSLPERIGGKANWDYRFAWVRDASLSLALLAMLGKSDEVRSYMDWLSGLGSTTDAPLQVVYGIDGRLQIDQIKRSGVVGYRNSPPVHYGNHAYSQIQHDSLGYFADCSLVYLENGGEWREEYWQLVRRSANYTARTWQEPDYGIWELSQKMHWVSSKVMSWVVMERAIKIARKLGRAAEAEPWIPVRDQIHGEVLEKGWSEALNSFRQYYGAETLDGALLLIAVMEFLPADDPRVLATARRIERELTVNGFVHRFDPKATPGVQSDEPMVYHEGAFFPTTFWLATTYAKAGLTDRAEAILANAEKLTGELGLFAEAVDAQSGMFLGNTPLLFSQVEYIRAKMELMKAKPLSSALKVAAAIVTGG